MSDLSLGRLRTYDIDVDGALDVVGGRGVILLASLETLEVPGVPTTNNGLAGLFNDDKLPDLVYATSTSDQIVVFPSVAFGGGDPIVTEAVRATSFDSHDYDGDGVDDLVTSLFGAGTEVWLARGDGTFSLDSALDTSPTSTPSFFETSEQGVGLAITNSITGAAVYRYDDSGGFLESEEIVAPGLFTVNGFDARGDGDEWLVGAWWFDNGFEVSAGVGLLFKESGEWMGLPVSLEGNGALDLADGDLDSDGIRDVVVLRADGANAVALDFLCLGTDALTPCGSTPLDHYPESVVVLPAPARIVYTTQNDGTWIGALEVGGCI